MNKDTRPKQLKVFAIGLPLLLLFFAWRHYTKAGVNGWTQACFLLAALSIFTSLLLRNIFARFFDGWMKVAGLIGFCVATVLLTIIYYGIFTPVAVVLRLSGQDFMARKFGRREISYWISCEDKTKSKDRYLQQF